MKGTESGERRGGEREEGWKRFSRSLNSGKNKCHRKTNKEAADGFNAADFGSSSKRGSTNVSMC